MTMKQCNSCKYHICVKELGERCFKVTKRFFMKNKNCIYYDNGEINQAHKEFFKKHNKKYPFTEIKD